MRKLTILFALAAMCCMMAFAANGTKIGNIYYILDDTNLTATVTWGGVSDIDGTPEYTGSIVIPGSVSCNSKVYQVTSIGENAFRSCPGLTSVTIPESVTSIGTFAFYSDHSLVSANIPLGVTRIEDLTFRGCTALASIVIPGGVTYIGDRAFMNCSALADMYVFAMTPPSVHTSAFNGMEKGTTFLYVPDVDVYKQADGWKEFTNMTTLDLTFRANAIAAIDAAIVGVTDAAILAIATQAKTEIGQTVTEGQANAIKDKALADIALLQAKADAIAAIDAAIKDLTLFNAEQEFIDVIKSSIQLSGTLENVNIEKQQGLDYIALHDAKVAAVAELKHDMGDFAEFEAIYAFVGGPAIESATTSDLITEAKNAALAKLEEYSDILGAAGTAGYNKGKEDGYYEGKVDGKAEGLEEGKAALPTDAEDAAGHTVTITKGEKTLKLVNPDKVTYGKQD